MQHDQNASGGAGRSAGGGGSALGAELEEWVRDVTGADRVVAERRAAGASREGWAIDACHHDGRVEKLWLRLDGGHGPQSDTIYTLRREATVYAALANTPVPVPRVVAVHPHHDAFIETRVEGRNWFHEIDDRDEQVRVASEFMRHLAALHRIDPGSLELPGFGAGRSLRDLVDAELDVWTEQASARGTPDPIAALALRWLRGNYPSEPGSDERVVLVQGDTGPGNFLFADGRVVAILDWELAHLGDPMDDLGWICVRDLQERFTDLRARFADYEAATGERIDIGRLRYFRLLAQTRCAIGTVNGLRARDASGETANHLIYSTLHLRVLAEALAEVAGVDPQLDTPPADEAGPRTWLYDVALDELRDTIVPASATAFAARRAKGLARVLKYLREADRIGDWATARELVDLRDLAGIDADGLDTGRARLSEAIAAGTVSDHAGITYAVRRMARETHLLRPAMGALADRHYAPLPGEGD
jgi:aminoglycoside phosphotransferase (APT) family kinase protein